MKAVVFKLGALGVGLLTALQVSGTPAAAAPAFTPAKLNGNFGFQIMPAKSFAAAWNLTGDAGGVAGAPRQDVLRVGALHFDGVSAVTGRMIATTDDNNGNTVVIDFTFNGTYTLNANGTGTMSIAPLLLDDSSCTPSQPPGDCATFEGPETYAISFSRNRGLSMAQTDNGGGGAKIFMVGEALLQTVGAPAFTVNSIRNTMSLRLAPATSFAANAPGDTGGVGVAGRHDLLQVGMMNFSGVGFVGGHITATTDDNAGNTVVIDFDFGGAYSVNADGTGKLSMIPVPLADSQCTPAQPPGICNTLEGTKSYAMVINRKKGRVYLNEIDNPGGAKIFLTGEANYQ